MKKLTIYPVWVRIWHIFSGLMFLFLLLSGLGLHFGLLNPHSAVLIHTGCGISLAALYLVFFAMNFATGNYKHYFKKTGNYWRNIAKECRYYFWDIFIKHELPYDPEKGKFGTVKKFYFVLMMYLIMPLMIVTGIILFVPGIYSNPDGLWTISMTHTILAYILTLMILFHLYLGTSGKTPGQLYRAIAKGWIEYDDISGEKHLPITMAKSIRDYLFPVPFYNPLTILGSILSILSFSVIIVLMLFEFVFGFSNPYVGIITFVLLPSLLVSGWALIFFGALWENKKRNLAEKGQPVLPVIDFNKPKIQRTAIFTTLSVVFLGLFSIIGSFKAYEYTESDEFCGKVCHKVMHPEYTAYKDSPHSHVGCVNCHIGPGAGWFVRSKLSGSWQMVSATFNLYNKPIPTPVEHLRPAQETCEHCHWPSNFSSDKKVIYDFFQSDEKNSETKLNMLIKIGGGTPAAGRYSGIHWYMNIANDIYYLATDDKRQVIPWVKSINKQTGKVTIYKKIGAQVTADMVKDDKLRKFDCIDCHNRPAHSYNVPYKTVNTAMSMNQIDPELPYIKNLAVQVLELGNHAITHENSRQVITKYLYDFYNKYYPEVVRDKKARIDESIEYINKIYLRNYFPEMNASWKHYPVNIGHMYSDGCFRCHDGQHVSDDGKVISHDCNVCHTISAIQSPTMTEIQRGIDLKFVHPGGEGLNVENRMCTDCHGVQKSFEELKKLAKK